MGERITCVNCGFLNEPGDEFCGDCGTYLAWSGTPEAAAADAGPTSPQQGAAPAPVPAPPPVPAAPAPVPAPPPVPAAPPPTQFTAAPPTQYTAPPVQPPTQYPPPPAPQAFQVTPPPAMGGQPCRTCGLVNPPGRSFCQRCGAKLDPAVGTMSGSPRPAAGPPVSAGAAGATSSGGGGKRLAIAGLALVIIATVAGAALFLSGALGPNRSASPTPPTALASDGPTDTDAPTDAPDEVTPEPTELPEPTAEPTTEPTEEPEPTPAKTPKPTKKPTPTPPTPSQAPAPGDYVCDGSTTTIQDPIGEGWNLRRIDWSNKGKYDRLIVTLDERGSGDNGTQAIVHVMPPDEVPATLKVSSPQAGGTAVALGLFQDVRLTWTLDRALTLPALKWITMEKDDNGFPWVVLGVKGDACYSLQVPQWTQDDPEPATTVLVTIDVEH